MELLKALFENAELPADFKEKTTTLFEAAVDERVKSELAQFQESYEKQLVEAKEAFATEAVATLDKLIEETVLEWAKENAVGLDSEIKGQIAESFLQGLKGIFEKADIELSGDTAGKELVKLQEQNAALEADAKAAKAALVEAEGKLVQIKIKEIIGQVTEGLADTQVHRVAKLCEAFEFKTEEDFRAKAALVVEAVGGKIKGVQDADGVIIAVDGEGSKGGNVVTPEGTVGEDGKLVEKPAGTSNTSAEGAKGEGENKGSPVSESASPDAPHLNADLISETLKLFK